MASGIRHTLQRPRKALVPLRPILCSRNLLASCMVFTLASRRCFTSGSLLRELGNKKLRLCFFKQLPTFTPSYPKITDLESILGTQRNRATLQFYERECQEKIFLPRAEVGRGCGLGHSAPLPRAVPVRGDEMPRVFRSPSGSCSFHPLEQQCRRRPAGGSRRLLVSALCFPS